jgi:hypothetical protein
MEDIQHKRVAWISSHSEMCENFISIKNEMNIPRGFDIHTIEYEGGLKLFDHVKITLQTLIALV